MPPFYKTVPSLYSLSLNNIVENMDSHWCKHFCENYYQTGPWIHVVGPFTCIPSSLCYDIFMAMKSKGKKKKHHDYLLIHPGFRHVDCSREEGSLPLILDLLSKRCARSLISLRISDCYKLPVKDFTKAFLDLKSLKKLDLSSCGEKVDDDLMALIGSHGSSLEELNIYGSMVEDCGIKMLVSPVNEHGKPDDNFGKCRGLRSLKMGYCNVTVHGAKVCLTNLEKLEAFQYDDSVDAICELIFEQPEKKICLKNLETWITITNSEDLSCSLGGVSILGSINLERAVVQELSTHDKLVLEPIVTSSISEITKICFIDVSDAEPPYDPFEKIWLQTLKSNGNTLSVFIFNSRSEEVNLSLILEFCPNLSFLCLENICSYTQPANPGQKVHVLRKLKKLTIICQEHYFGLNGTPYQSDLQVLLSSYNTLEVIELTGCKTFNDELMSKMTNEFSALKSLCLSECNDIMLDSLKMMLYVNNPLSLVRLSACRSITLAEVNRYKSFLKSKKVNNVKVDGPGGIIVMHNLN